MVDDPKAVLAQLPPATIKHPVKLKDLRIQWDHGCAKILQDAHLSQEQKIKVVMDWLSKLGPGIRDFVLGKLILGFARPLPPPATEEQRKERRQKTLVRLTYTDDLPHLRAVNKVVTNRLESLPSNAAGSLKAIDALDEREAATPNIMFAEFAKSIEDQAAIEYQPSNNADSGSPFVDAA